MENSNTCWRKKLIFGFQKVECSQDVWSCALITDRSFIIFLSIKFRFLDMNYLGIFFWFDVGIDNMSGFEKCILITVIISFHQFFFVPSKVIEEDSRRCNWNLKYKRYFIIYIYKNKVIMYKELIRMLQKFLKLFGMWPLATNLNFVCIL